MKSTNDAPNALERGNLSVTFLGLSLRPLSLVTLAVQNSTLILLMRYSRTLDGPLYLASTAVLLNEFIKFSISVVIYCITEWPTQYRKQVGSLPVNSQNINSGSFLHSEQQALFSDASDRDVDKSALLAGLGRLVERAISGDAWKLSIPALLYTVQNNLQYLAVSNLDAATFQVTYQMKILTTAIFSVAMLGKRLTWIQWIALILLTAGIALVQLPQQSEGGTDTRGINEQKAAQSLVGLVSVFTACCLSGLAGVYFEKILKKRTVVTTANQGPLLRDQERKLRLSDEALAISTSPVPPSIWVRNVQLAFFGTNLAVVVVFLKDSDSIVEHGFFHGYNALTWMVILCQALGGLLVAMVVKYADNILKGFATSVSIIISCLLSIWAFDFHVTAPFVFGCMLVIYSTYLYDSPLAHG